MTILTGTLHCPCCGSTDPTDWRESAGTPTWCLSDTATITEECDENCDHLELDELNDALAMLGPAPTPSPGAQELFTGTSPFRPAPAWLAQSGHPWLTGHGI